MCSKCGRKKMDKVFTLAKNTLSEMLREKLFLVVLIMAVLLFGLSLVLGALSFDEEKKIMTDFGFAAIQLASLGIALFSGSYMLAREIEKQTCLLILSRPVSRDQFILGKFFGVLALNTLLMIFLGLCLAGLLKVWERPQELLPFTEICLSLWCESILILGLVLLFIVRPVIALSFGIMVFLLGHWLGDLEFFAKASKQALFIHAVKVLQWVSPNLYRMNWKSVFYLEKGIPSQDVLWMIAHSLGWIVLLLLLTNFLFRRKDIV